MCDHAVVKTAEQLIATIDAREHVAEQAFSEGFKIGFEDGEQIGYRRAHAEMAEAWRHVAEKVRAMGRSRYLNFAELQQARYGAPHDNHQGSE